MSSMLPSWLRVAFLGEASARTLVFKADATKVTGRRQLTAPASLLTHDRPAVPRLKRPVLADVVIPSRLLLTRKIEAPAKASGKIDALAALDLRQNTPFAEGSVLWALGRRKSTNRGVVANQYVAKSSDIAAIRRRLGEVDVRMRRVLVEDEQGCVLEDYSREVAPGSRFWRMANGGLAATALALGAYIWLWPAFLAGKEADALDTEIAALRPQALDLRQNVDSLRAEQDEETLLLEELKQRPRLVEVLREASVAIPDEAWVSTVTFRPDAVSLQGETSDAAVDLVLGLSDKRQFGNPRLSGATTRTSGGKERFEIALDPRGDR